MRPSNRVLSDTLFMINATRNTVPEEIRPQYDALIWALERALERGEDEDTISEWANATFGEPVTNMSIATRANKEMAELLHCLAMSDTDPKAAEESADTVIVLCRLFKRLRVSLQEAVDQKMAVNRSRTWVSDGVGHGQHVKDRDTHVRVHEDDR